jgi:hypothetical protein
MKTKVATTLHPESRNAKPIERRELLCEAVSEGNEVVTLL